MTKNRNKYDIFAKMLKSCGKGVTKTNLMYDARVNYQLVQLFLNRLISFGLVETRKIGKQTIYLTSDSGKEFLKHYLILEGLTSKSDSEISHKMPKISTSS